MKLGITRSDFLRGAIASVATAAVSSSRAADAIAQLAPPSAGRPAPSLLDLEFTIVEQFRPFDLLPEVFVQVREQFREASVRRLMRTGLQSEGTLAQMTLSPGRLRLTSSRAEPTLLRTEAGPVAPYCTVVVTTGASETGTDEAGTIAAGLVRDASNYVVTSFERNGDPAKGTVAIDVRVEGRTTRVAAANADLAGATRCAFTINENYVTALVARGADWVPVAQHRITDLLDLRSPAVLRQYRYGFGAGGAGATVTIADVRAGYFGQAGIRDLHVISHSDGRPYVRNGKLYFTATQAGLSFFQAAHWGVWTLDLDEPRQVEPVAALFFERGGLVLGDHAGQIVADEHDGGFHVAVSSWGDFAFKGVHVRYCRTFKNILSGVHVLETARLSLPTDVSAWDPSMVRIGGRWYVGFVESPYQDPTRGFNFHPALARSDRGGSLNRLSKVGADLSRNQTEGTILQKVGGRWYLLASDGVDRQYRVYDLSMKLLGFLKAPYGSNLPHPQVIPISSRGQTTYLLITFEGTQYHEELLGYGTHGDLIVMRAAQTRRGSEFERP
ncbi:MAG TPA: hypothetical protein VK434_16935 [Microvirga sp.]|nr:hypothetical protein [Microvirga sp.]